MARPVVIEDYTPTWADRFADLRELFGEALRDVALAIEHVGSTAIPGLAAKPIIDIDIVIASRSMLPEAIARLATIGYRHEGDLGIADREAFAPPSGPIDHHVYVCNKQSPELRRHRAFRDYLIAHPEAMRAYAALKRQAAERFRDDREGYTQAKTDFVAGILERAMRRTPR
jgi:GrpB-like predicted nucleotidyltransferase (UPF0157 family)